MPIVDCVYERGQFFLPLRLNESAPHHFIFDTGAGVSAVDAKLADELGLPKVAHTELAGTAGILEVDQVRIARIMPLARGRGVAKLSWYGLTPTKQDLSAFHVPVPGASEGGLLGNDYLQSFVVQLHFAPALVEISRPTGFPPAGVDPGSYIPFFLDLATIVRVSGKLDGWMDVPLRFDTGSATMTVEGPYLNITTNMWQALRDRHPEYEVSGELKANAIGVTDAPYSAGRQSLPLSQNGLVGRFQPLAVQLSPKQPCFRSTKSLAPNLSSNGFFASWV